MAKPQTPEELFAAIVESGALDSFPPEEQARLRQVATADTFEEAVAAATAMLGSTAVDLLLDTDVPPGEQITELGRVNVDGDPTGQLAGRILRGEAGLTKTELATQYVEGLRRDFQTRYGVDPTDAQLTAVATGAVRQNDVAGLDDQSLEEIIAAGPGQAPQELAPLPAILGGLSDEEDTGRVYTRSDTPSGRGGFPHDPIASTATGIVRNLPGQDSDTTRFDARYREGEEWRSFVGRSTESKAQIQQNLAAAGLINIDDVSLGNWDVRTQNAMSTVMALANQNGETWSRTLQQLVASPPASAGGSGRAARVFPGLVYREPDWATLAQAAKTTVRGQLGRDPEDWEVAILGDELKGASRAGFDKDLAAAKREFYGSGGDLGTIERVNPADRFMEEFEKLYGPEIDRQGRVSQTQQNFATLMRSFGSGQAQVER